ncbi:MAG: (2Fe-2S) ferredoxin domain-containing protein [Leptolyngbyaceae cyanobacterium CSU_1_4]|nr:(2Fe-2S) ferredoxin domain-containing protein [Leptolyngbyaceae cyanobacterium CSU_1_4]
MSKVRLLQVGCKSDRTALQAAIQEQGLTHQVIVKGTGCMKRCKAGPNLVMPDKTRYTKISPKAIPALIEQHFAPGTPAISVPTVAHRMSANPPTTTPSVGERVAS